MVVWSSFILDEMAGLRADALPTCPECAADPAFLARNSGVVTAITGPDGNQGAQFGEVVSWAVTADAQADAAQQFVSYMMGDGYEQWIGFAPEGKVPALQGQGALVGAALGELPVPQSIAAMTGGELTPEQAAQQATEALREIATSLD